MAWSVFDYVTRKLVITGQCKNPVEVLKVEEKFL